MDKEKNCKSDIEVEELDAVTAGAKTNTDEESDGNSPEGMGTISWLGDRTCARCGATRFPLPGGRLACPTNGCRG